MNKFKQILFVLLALILLATPSVFALTLSDYSLFAGNQVHIGGGTDVHSGWVGSNKLVDMAGSSSAQGISGAGTFNTKNGVNVHGDIIQNGLVKIGGANHIHSNVYVQGNVANESNGNIYHGNVTASGTITGPPSTVYMGSKNPNTVPSQTYTPIVLPLETSFTAGSTNYYQGNGQTLNLAPGSYGIIDFAFNGTLNLTSGIYYFNSLNFESGGKLNLNLSSGDIQMYIVNNVHTGFNFTMDAFGADPNKIYTELHGNWSTASGADILGTVYASRGDIRLGHGTHVLGHLWAADYIDTEHNSLILIPNAPIPEPMSLSLLGLGLGGLGFLKRRKLIK